MTIYLYFIIKRFTKPLNALIGACLFATHISKHEILIRIQGLLYHVVMFLFILLLDAVTRPNAAYKKRTHIIASLLLIISFHYYEVLIIVGPFYLLFYAYYFYFLNKEKKYINYLYSSLPLIACFYHIAILKFGSKVPVWNRNPNIPQTPTNLIKWFFGSMKNGYSKLLGHDYFHDSTKLWNSFLEKWTEQNPIFLIPLLCLFIFVVVSIVLKHVNFKNLKNKDKPLTLYLFIALFIIIAPAVGFITFVGTTPGRLTYFPSCLFGILVALILDKISNLKKRTFYIGALIIAVSFLSYQIINYHQMIFQYSQTAIVNQKIDHAYREAIKEVGDKEYFVTFFNHSKSLPEYSRNQIVPTPLASAENLTLLWQSRYRDRNKDIPYRPVFALRSHVMNTLDHISKLKEYDTITAFYIDENLKLFSLKKIEVIAKNFNQEEINLPKSFKFSGRYSGKASAAQTQIITNDEAQLKMELITLDVN
jgi:hypothetical protein